MIGVAEMLNEIESKQHTNTTNTNTLSPKARAQHIIKAQTRQSTRNLIWYFVGLSVILIILLLTPSIFNSNRSILSSFTTAEPFPKEKHIIKYPDMDAIAKNDVLPSTDRIDSDNGQ